VLVRFDASQCAGARVRVIVGSRFVASNARYRRP
jgi:hypothetical protein